MNTPAPYEELIAQKMEQLPVPDMSDQIWDSIALGLDIPAEPSFKKIRVRNGKWWLYGMITAVIVSVLLWVFVQKKDDTAATKQVPENLPPVEYKQPEIDSNVSTHPEEKYSPVITAPIIKKNGDTINALDDRISTDSIFPSIIPLRIDSFPVEREKIVSPRIDSINIAPQPPGKKPKGVKGITPNDYRIYGQKNDSAKKKD